jgi:hypothetical protein
MDKIQEANNSEHMPCLQGTQTTNNGPADHPTRFMEENI